MEKQSKKIFQIAALLNATLLLVTPVIVLLFAGFLLDTHFHTLPFFLIIGVILGFVSGIGLVVRIMHTLS